LISNAEEIYKRFWDLYATKVRLEDRLLKKLHEEVAELTLAMKGRSSNVWEEVVDVVHVALQIARLYGLSSEGVNNISDRKKNEFIQKYLHCHECGQVLTSVGRPPYYIDLEEPYIRCQSCDDHLDDLAWKQDLGY
jgi:predicted house-cleaning noncanonical NTP pyrophosphatase (MazG superfamily)